MTLARLEHVAAELNTACKEARQPLQETTAQQPQLEVLPARSSGASVDTQAGANRTLDIPASMQCDPLLMTKLRIPRPPAQLVHRG